MSSSSRTCYLYRAYGQMDGSLRTLLTQWPDLGLGKPLPEIEAFYLEPKPLNQYRDRTHPFHWYGEGKPTVIDELSEAWLFWGSGVLHLLQEASATRCRWAVHQEQPLDPHTVPTAESLKVMVKEYPVLARRDWPRFGRERPESLPEQWTMVEYLAEAKTVAWRLNLSNRGVK